MRPAPRAAPSCCSWAAGPACALPRQAWPCWQRHAAAGRAGRLSGLIFGASKRCNARLPPPAPGRQQHCRARPFCPPSRPQSWASPLLGGGIVGYVLYDTTHWALHSGRAEWLCGHVLKTSHMDHHYVVGAGGWGLGAGRRGSVLAQCSAVPERAARLLGRRVGCSCGWPGQAILAPGVARCLLACRASGLTCSWQSPHCRTA